VPTVLLLLLSNCFMTYAWYGHVKKPGMVLWVAILSSWLIALPEYCLAVKANRLGHVDFGGRFTTPQLKILQEGISIAVFLGFSLWFLKEIPRWQDLAAFGLIFAGLALALMPRG
jgi:uncharacterized protein (DUF486 family)